MEMTKLDLRSAAERPRKVHLHGPDGQPLWDGDKPCCALVIGSASVTAQAAVRARAKAAMTAPPKDEPVTPEDRHNEAVAAAIMVTVGFENMERDGKPCTVADAEWVYNLDFASGRVDGNGKIVLPSFAQQVLQVAGDNPGFLNSASPS